MDATAADLGPLVRAYLEARQALLAAVGGRSALETQRAGGGADAD
jgi:hypothetical protein